MADVMQPPKGGEPDTPEQKKPVPLVNDGLSPSDVDFIPPLVHSLVTLLRLRGKSVSTAFLMAGLAGTGRVSPGACLHAAKRAGLEGKIVYRKSLQDISTLVLPCILLLSRDRSCVLTSLDDGKAGVIFPETGEGVQPVPLQMLADEYTGYAIFATREARLDQRADRIRLLKGKRWFWDVLLYYMPIYRHVAFASVVINLIGVISPLFVMNVYDRVIPNNAVDTLWVLAIGILIAYLFDFLLRNLRSYFVDVAGRNADVVLSSRLVQKVLTMRLDAKPESTGALVNNLREFESLREFFSSSTLLAFIDLPFLVVALTNAARNSAQFSAQFGTPLTCAFLQLAHCMQRARKKFSGLFAFRLSELYVYSRYHFRASCSGTSPYSPLSDSKSQIPLFSFFARPI